MNFEGKVPRQIFRGTDAKQGDMITYSNLAHDSHGFLTLGHKTGQTHNTAWPQRIASSRCVVAQQPDGILSTACKSRGLSVTHRKALPTYNSPRACPEPLQMRSAA